MVRSLTSHFGRPSQWILDNASQIQDVLTQVETADDLVAAVGIANVAAVAGALRSAVREAAAQQGKILEEQLIRASVDDARVEAFAAAVRESWGKRRTAATLLRLAGACEVIDGSNPDARYGYQAYEPKDWYVSDRIAGLEGHAQQIGNVIAAGENAKLYEAVAGARALRRSAGDINQRLDHAIEAMRQNGYKPTTIFVPWRVWELPPELDLRPLPDSHGGPDVLCGRLGTFRDLDVIEVRDLPADRVVLADLRAFVTFRQWTRGAEALVVTVVGFDEQTAAAAARADRQLLRQRGRTKLADRALELSKLALVQVLEEFAIQVNDPEAARAVLLPPAGKVR